MRSADFEASVRLENELASAAAKARADLLTERSPVFLRRMQRQYEERFEYGLADEVGYALERAAAREEKDNR